MASPSNWRLKAWRILVKASHAIEGERPPPNRAERREHAIGVQARQRVKSTETHDC